MPEEKKDPMCFRCVHPENTWRKIPGTDIPIDKCRMVGSKITPEDYPFDCNRFYRQNMDD